MNKEVKAYHSKLNKSDKEISEILEKEISANLKDAENKVWHAHPVWFLEGNPIVGYSKQKEGVKLMFWSGVDFGDTKLKPGSGKFKDASIFYADKKEIKLADLKKWLKKSREIQWDYKNIVKRKGKLEKIDSTQTKPKITFAYGNGDACKVIGGTHAGKSGKIEDIKLSKTGHITLTVIQKSGVRFKTLGKNISNETK
jgi:uncharacterized protein YdhG (YjbR/CyaY superfamily)